RRVVIMFFSPGSVLDRDQLLFARSLDVSRRVLLRLGQTFRAAEIDRASEKDRLVVFVLDLIAGHGAGRDAVSLAQKLALRRAGLRRLLVLMFVVRERRSRQRDYNDQRECFDDVSHDLLQSFLDVRYGQGAAATWRLRKIEPARSLTLPVPYHGASS